MAIMNTKQRQATIDYFTKELKQRIPQRVLVVCDDTKHRITVCWDVSIDGQVYGVRHGFTVVDELYSHHLVELKIKGFVDKCERLVLNAAFGRIEKI